MRAAPPASAAGREKGRAKGAKFSAGRKVQLPPDPLPDCGCCDCSTLPSGGVFSCEDGVCTYIPKPGYFAVLVSDPNFALPYWARPTDLGLNCPAGPGPAPVAGKGKAARRPKRGGP